MSHCMPHDSVDKLSLHLAQIIGATAAAGGAATAGAAATAGGAVAAGS